VGDKAFYLGRAIHHGHPVVPGVVLPTQALSQFLETLHWEDPERGRSPWLVDFLASHFYVDVGQPKQLQAIAQTIRRAIMSEPFPNDWLAAMMDAIRTLDTPYVVCRPSVSVAGLTDLTFSSTVCGLLSPQYCQAESEAIAQAIKAVWAEAFRAKSLLVWQRANISLQSLRIGVLIQPIYPSLASGTVQLQGNRLDIAACWGLGIAAKAGEVLPDQYHVNAKLGMIQRQTLGHKPYAYGIASEPCPYLWQALPSIDQPALVSHAWRQVLNRYEVKQPYQAVPVLSQSTLSTLVNIHHALVESSDFNPMWEWVLGTVPPPLDDTLHPTTQLNHQQVYLYITQVLPKKTGTPAPPPTDLALEKTWMPLTQASPSTPLATPVINALGAASGQVIAPVWVVGQTPSQSIAQLPTGYVVVATEVMPDWMLDIQRAVAIVSEQGGLTCHAAIVARELGIPAVVGAQHATERLTTGDKVLINGDRGTIYRLDPATPASSTPLATSEPSPISGAIAPPSASPSSSADTALPHDVDAPTCSVSFSEKKTPSDGALLNESQRHQRTQLMASVSRAESLSLLQEVPIDGIGLLRGELLLPQVLNHQPLTQWLQSGQKRDLIDQVCDRLRPFLDAVYPCPVYYRTADLRPNEYADLLGHPQRQASLSAESSAALNRAQNPLLGEHGTFSYMHDSTLFKLELAVLRQLRADGYENIHVMLPFVRTVEEFIACRHIILQANLLEFPSFQVWIMAEVPSVVFLLPEYVEAGVSGIAIGTNDLTQLILALDRNHPTLSQSLDPRHPAVMRAVERLVKTARELSIPCSICGEAPGQYPELIRSYVEWGVTSISVSPGVLAATYRAIAYAEQSLE
jgi:pyruvate,water dikinase